MNLSELSAPELLALHAKVADQLRTRGITRSANNPTGDLAEYLFCKAFGWNQAGNSRANIDAIGPDGIRYQIKGRRITRYNSSRQLSAIRDLGGAHFDFLAGVLFDEDYGITRAALIPHAVAMERACPGDFVSGAPPPTARLTLDLADCLGLSRVNYCFHYHRDSSLVRAIRMRFHKDRPDW